MTRSKNKVQAVQSAIRKHYADHRYHLNNVFIYQWESDVFSVNPQSKATYEFEIKLSKSDFMADFRKKKVKHQILEQVSDTQERRPNHFYYVSTPGIIEQDKIPVYAGLIECDPDTSLLTIIKKAPKIHSQVFNLDRILVSKFYYRTLALEQHIRNLEAEVNSYHSDKFQQIAMNNPIAWEEAVVETPEESLF